jgi:indolepyruvate ferredoxin oxidoreductase beta subunit
MHIATTSVSGFLLLRILSGLRWWRRHTWRFHKEQALIGQWLAAISAAAAKDRTLALEIALCGQIVKGYGDTHARAVKSFTLIRDNYFDVAKRAGDTSTLAAAIHVARKAALSDPEGQSLEQHIAQGVPIVTAIAKPVLHRETIH